MNQGESNAKAIVDLLDSMIEQQRQKCLRIARRLNPNLTADDVLNAFDWPEVNENPQFIWEDGLLAGLQSAHAAVCARLREQLPTTWESKAKPLQQS